MNSIFYIFFHWLHLVAAISSLGASIFLAMVVFPTLKRLGGDLRAAFLEKAHSKVMMVVLHSYALLLITGFVNMTRSFRPTPTSLYMTLFLAKIVLVLILFTIGLMLFIPSEALKNFQSRRPFWITVNVFIGLAIVFLSGWLRLEGQYGERPDQTYHEDAGAKKRGAAQSDKDDEIVVEVPDSAAI